MGEWTDGRTDGREYKGQDESVNAQPAGVIGRQIGGRRA